MTRPEIFSAVYFFVLFIFTIELSVQQSSPSQKVLVNCTFEEPSICNFTYDRSHSKAEWLRHSGNTPSSQTGPNGDHTTGGGYYMYMEASNKKEGDEARLLFPTFSGSRQVRCVSFFYSMYNAGSKDVMGELKLVAVDANGAIERRLWSIKGGQGPGWKNATVKIPAGFSDLAFIAVRGSSYQGDIAIDDVVLEEGECVETMTTVSFTMTTDSYTVKKHPVTSTEDVTVDITTPDVPTTADQTPAGITIYSALTQHLPEFVLNCEFEESSMCNFTYDKNRSVAEWIRHQGKTPSGRTGPAGDHTTGAGYYIYMEASGVLQDSEAWLLFPPLLGSMNAQCLRFYYHMYANVSVSSVVGSLKVVVVNSTGSVTQTLWSMRNNQGPAWKNATVDIPVEATSLAFVAKKAGSYLSDIAVDDVTIKTGSCVGHLTSEAASFTVSSTIASTTTNPTTTANTLTTTTTPPLTTTTTPTVTPTSTAATPTTMTTPPTTEETTLTTMTTPPSTTTATPPTMTTTPSTTTATPTTMTTPPSTTTATPTTTTAIAETTTPTTMETTPTTMTTAPTTEATTQSITTSMPITPNNIATMTNSATTLSTTITTSPATTSSSLIKTPQSTMTSTPTKSTSLTTASTHITATTTFVNNTTTLSTVTSRQTTNTTKPATRKTTPTTAITTPTTVPIPPTSSTAKPSTPTTTPVTVNTTPTSTTVTPSRPTTKLTIAKTTPTTLEFTTTATNTLMSSTIAFTGSTSLTPASAVLTTHPAVLTTPSVVITTPTAAVTTPKMSKTTVYPKAGDRENQKKENDEANAGKMMPIIAGAAGGGVAVLLTILIIVIIMRRRRLTPYTDIYETPSPRSSMYESGVLKVENPTYDVTLLPQPDVVIHSHDVTDTQRHIQGKNGEAISYTPTTEI